MKKIALDSEERRIEKEADEYVSASKAGRKKIEKLLDRSKKSRPISLRINQEDLDRLKKMADKTGLPYQTMINVVIHKYVTNGFLDKDEIDKFLKLRKRAA